MATHGTFESTQVNGVAPPRETVTCIVPGAKHGIGLLERKEKN